MVVHARFTEKSAKVRRNFEGVGADFQKATERVYRGGAQASSLLLPVLNSGLRDFLVQAPRMAPIRKSPTKT